MPRSAAAAARIVRFPFAAMLLALFVSGCGVNNIPTYEEQAKAKWSEVQNQYQRRADLIPNLVETVKGYARQEREVLEAVTNARARATAIQVHARNDQRPGGVQELPGGAGAVERARSAGCSPSPSAIPT